MATTRFYLDLRGKAQDGKGSIYITITHNRTTAMIPTGIRVSPAAWDGMNIKKVPGSDSLNANIYNQKAKIDTAIANLSLTDRFNRMTATDIKNKVYCKKVSAIDSSLVSSVFEEYMQTDMKQGTKEIYASTLRKVMAFGGENLRMENIDLKWLLQFEKYLSKTQGVNGRAIYLRSLRAICNYALHTRVIATYPFENFKIKQEPTKKRNIPVELFRKFLSVKVSNRVQMYRDYFMLIFYLIGINVKDLLLADKSSIVDGRFEYVREKTGKKYSIKIQPEAEELLKKYAGENYLLDAMDHCTNYKSFAREINDGLREVGDTKWEMVPDENDLFGTPKLKKTINPVIPGLTTYYARHSWATFAYELGISLDIISQALGHSFGNRTTLIYVEYDQEKVDSANRKVIDFLFS